MNFHLYLAGRYLAGRKLRTSLTILSIIFGVMLIFGLNGILPPVKDSFRRNLLQTVGQADLTITAINRGSFANTTLAAVTETTGVQNVSGSLIRPVLLPPTQALPVAGGTAVNSLIIHGLDRETASQSAGLSLTAGTFFGDQFNHPLLISEPLARRTGLTMGSEIPLPASTGSLTFIISGFYSSQPGSEETVYIPLASAQQLFNASGQINTMNIIYTADVQPEQVESALLTRLGPGFKVGGNSAGSEILTVLEMGEWIYTAFGAMTLAMSGFIIFNTFRTIIIERQRDIGMLRAVGASRRTIFLMLLFESLVQGVIGTVLGLIGGYLIAYGLLLAIEPIWQNLMQVGLGPPSFSGRTFGLAIILGLGVTLLGGLWPALAASRTTPLEALQPTPGTTSTRQKKHQTLAGVGLFGLALLTLISDNLALVGLGIILFMLSLTLLGPVLVAPISRIFGRLLLLIFVREGHIALGNVTRQSERAAVTASAMTIGLAIIVGLASIIASLNAGIVNWLDQTLGADYLIMPQSFILGGGNIGANAQLAADVTNLEGIEQVTTLRLSPGRLAEADIQLIGLDPVTYPQLSGLAFSDGQDQEIYPQLDGGRTMIVNGLLAAQQGLQVGQVVELETVNGRQTYEIIGIGSDFLNLKLPTSYISQANLATDFHETADVLIMANQQATASTAQVSQQLQELLTPYPAFSLYESGVWRADLLQNDLAKLNVMYILLIILAIPSLIALMNTLLINVLERLREIGMLRAVGATRRQIGRIIVAESLLLATVGTAFGIIGGIWLGYFLVEALQFGGFAVPYFFPYLGILATVAAGLLFAVLGALIPARRAAETDIISALAYE